MQAGAGLLSMPCELPQKKLLVLVRSVELARGVDRNQQDFALCSKNPPHVVARFLPVRRRRYLTEPSSKPHGEVGEPADRRRAKPVTHSGPGSQLFTQDLLARERVTELD